MPRIRWNSRSDTSPPVITPAGLLYNEYHAQRTPPSVDPRVVLFQTKAAIFMVSDLHTSMQQEEWKWGSDDFNELRAKIIPQLLELAAMMPVPEPG